jgi:hypothetical protein
LQNPTVPLLLPEHLPAVAPAQTVPQSASDEHVIVVAENAQLPFAWALQMASDVQLTAGTGVK